MAENGPGPCLVAPEFRARSCRKLNARFRAGTSFVEKKI